MLWRRSVLFALYILLFVVRLWKEPLFVNKNIQNEFIFNQKMGSRLLYILWFEQKRNDQLGRFWDIVWGWQMWLISFYRICNNFLKFIQKIKDLRGEKSTEYKICTDSMLMVWQGLLSACKQPDALKVDLNEFLF